MLLIVSFKGQQIISL